MRPNSEQNNDNDLLTRLNALRPSSVTLQQDASVLPSDDEVHSVASDAAPTSREDRLTLRLRELRTGSATGSSMASLGGVAGGSAGHGNVGVGVAGDRFERAKWNLQVANRQGGVNALSPVSGPGGTVDNALDRGEDVDVDVDALDSLLADCLGDLNGQDVKQVLEESTRLLDETRLEEERAHGQGKTLRAENVPSAEEQHDEEQRYCDPDVPDEDAEADEAVARILAELELESGSPDDDPTTGHAASPSSRDSAGSDDTTHGEPLSHSSHPPSFFPDTPTTAPAAAPTDPAISLPSPSHPPPSYDDSQLAARLARLTSPTSTLHLPSTPSAAPTSHPPRTTTSKPSQPSDSSPTPDEIDSWCIICNADGEVECLGCDADIYCRDCWVEGHGNGPGQERGHRAQMLVGGKRRKGGKGKAEERGMMSAS